MLLLDQQLESHLADVAGRTGAPGVGDHELGQYMMSHRYYYRPQPSQLQCQPTRIYYYLSIMQATIKYKPLPTSNSAFGVEVILSNGTSKPVWKTLEQFRNLENSLSDLTFDVEKRFDKKLTKDEPEIAAQVAQFLKDCEERQDIQNSGAWRQFFGLGGVEVEYLEEWSRAQVGSPNMKIIDFCYDPSEMVLITLEKQDNSIQKITNFFKTLLSQETKAGVVKVCRLHQQWKQECSIPLEAEPIGLIWARKSGLLLVGTSIGIFIYTIGFEGKAVVVKLLDFAKGYNIRSFCFDVKSGLIYYCTETKIWVHSLNQQFTMELATKVLIDVGSIGLDKHHRLYVCESRGLRIYDASNPKELKELTVVEGVSCFNKIHIAGDKYLFGLSETGFISVIELRPPGKERLTCTLTNVECPSHSPFLAYQQKGQMFVTSYGKSIVLVSTKNVPLFAGGAQKCPITAGIYEEESNVIACAGQDGLIIFYNISMHA